MFNQGFDFVAGFGAEEREDFGAGGVPFNLLEGFGVLLTAPYSRLN